MQEQQFTHHHHGVLGRWRVRAHGMLTLLLGLWLACPIVAVGLFVVLREDAALVEMSTTRTVMHWIVIAGFGLSTLPLGWLFIRHCTVPSLVTDYEGEICPTCIKPMKPAAGQSGPDAEMRCDECTAQFNRLGLRAYWNGFPTPAWCWRHWYFQRAKARSPLHARWLAVQAFMHRHVQGIARLICIASGVPLALLFTAGLTWTWVWDPLYLFFYFAPPLLVLGWFIGSAASFRYVYEQRAQCRQCKYDKHGDGDASPVCPECGCRWNAIGGTKYVSYQYKPAVMSIATVSLILGFALMMFSAGLRLPQKYASTDALIDIVIGSSQQSVGEWMELRQRTMAPTQRDRLFDAIMNKRDNSGQISGVAGRWMADQLVAGSLSEAQRQRHFQGMINLQLDGPDRLSLGEDAQVSMITDRRSSAFLGPTHIYFGGFSVSNAPSPIDRSNQAHDSTLFGHQLNPLRWLPRDAQMVHPRCIVKGQSLGELVVTAEVWIVVRPSQTSPEAITWNEDGTPQLPDDVIWSTHEQLEHRINVVAKDA